MFRALSPILIVLLAFIACQQTEPTDTTTAAPDTAATETQPAAAEPAVLEGFSTPESVLYDAEQDVYFVSNINGSPLDVDDNGFISRVNAETKQIDAKWIDGASDKVKLSAPKGLAIVGDELWVTDITSIAKFDRKTGEPKGTFAIKGATFLNDLDSEAGVYATDTGMKAGAGGAFEGTGTDAIWEVTGSQPKLLASGKDLNRPNGVAISAGNVWAVSFGGNELYGISDGKKTSVVTLPAGSLDGLEPLDDGTFLVSSWDSKTVYRGSSAGPFQPVVENVDSPADIGFDSKRQLILVPHFMENKVSIHPLR